MKTAHGHGPFFGLLLAALCAIVSWVAFPGQVHAQTPSYTGMVSFGDSLSDVGNTVSSLTETGARVLTGYNPNFYYPGRYSNGPVWVDYLYASLGFGPIGTMPRNDGIVDTDGTNFAWAGARSGTGYVAYLIPNLQTQVGYYTEQLADNNPALPDPSTTLFTLWAGGNDAFANVEDNDPITPAQVAANIATAITSLYDAGGEGLS